MKRQSLHHTWIFSHSLMQEPKMLKCITELEVSINNVEEQQLQKQGFMKIDVDLSIDRTFSTKKGYCAAITRIQLTFIQDMHQGWITTGYLKINKYLNPVVKGDCINVWYYPGSSEGRDFTCGWRERLKHTSVTSLRILKDVQISTNDEKHECFQKQRYDRCVWTSARGPEITQCTCGTRRTTPSRRSVKWKKLKICLCNQFGDFLFFYMKWFKGVISTEDGKKDLNISQKSNRQAQSSL